MLIVATLALAASGACSRGVTGLDPLGPGTRMAHITVDGHDRSFALHVPAALPAGRRVPLVIVLHGYSGNGPRMEHVTGFSALADSVGLIVAYPNGERSATVRRHWDDHGQPSADVDFLRALIDTLERREPVDASRVYVAGFSSGAFMAYRVGRSLSDRVAAIGVVSGSAGRRQAAQPDESSLMPPHPVPAIIFHGMADPVVPYDAEHGRGGRMRGLVAAPRSAALWAEGDGCGATPRVDTLYAGDAIRTAYAACRDGADVVLYAIPRGGHTWPLANRAGARVPATALMWEFFAAHPRR